MNALLLWVLGILGVLLLLWGLTSLGRGGLWWMGFGTLLAVFGLGGAWIHHQFGAPVFWGLGLLGVLLLVWAFLNLRRGRIAGWTAALAILLGLVGFGSITLLSSPNQNLLTSGTIPDPLSGFRTNPATSQTTTPTTPDTTGAAPVEPSPTPAIPEPSIPQPTPEPSPPPTQPSPALPTPTPTAVSGSVREVEPACPCLLNVTVNAPNPTIRILRGTTEIASSRQGRSSFLLEAGEYTLQVEAPGYRTFSTLIDVPRNKNLEVELVQ